MALLECDDCTNVDNQAITFAVCLKKTVFDIKTV